MLDIELQKEQNDKDREAALFHQVALLAEERNAVLVPQSQSGMPGAPEPDEAKRPVGQEVSGFKVKIKKILKTFIATCSGFISCLGSGRVGGCYPWIKVLVTRRG